VLQRTMAAIPIVIPVVSNSIMKVQNQAVALNTKGFNCPGEKTIYRDLHKEKPDHVLKWLSIALCVASVGYRIVVAFL